jgi:hypothetical protein
MQPRSEEAATGPYPEPDVLTPFPAAYVVAKNPSNSEAQSNFQQQADFLF